MKRFGIILAATAALAPENIVPDLDLVTGERG